MSQPITDIHDDFMEYAVAAIRSSADGDFGAVVENLKLSIAEQHRRVTTQQQQRLLDIVTTKFRQPMTPAQQQQESANIDAIIGAAIAENIMETERQAAIRHSAREYIDNLVTLVENCQREEMLRNLPLLPDNLITSPIFLWMYNPQNPQNRVAIATLLDLISEQVMSARQPEIVMVGYPAQPSLVFRLDVMRLIPAVRRLRHTIYNRDPNGQSLLSVLLNAGDTDLAQLIPDCEVDTEPYNATNSARHFRRS